MNSLSEVTLLIAVIALAAWPSILIFLLKKKDRNITQVSGSTVKNLTTEKLIMDSLKKLGCNPEKKNDGNIAFMYQGDDFYLSLQEDSPFIMFWYPWWGTISSDNPTLPYLKELINAINVTSFVTTVVMGDEDDSKEIGIHSHCHTFFTQSDYDPEEHIRVILDSFFETRDAIKEGVNKLGSSISDEDNKKERVIVKGFSAYKDKSIPLEKTT